ncbi:MAG: ABC transporter permease [Planctomycetes bacterium]|nr:ABC transporter permease [Planctomycetota bacterium]
MTRVLGVLGLLVALYAGLACSDANAVDAEGLTKIANLQGRAGVITLGAALVIIAGGIDLSIGSVVACSAVLFGVLMERGCHPYLALPLVLAFGAAVGLVNGLLVTRLKLQPFLVTLCGMFVYRGAARLLAEAVSVSRVVQEKPRVHPEFAGAIQNLQFLLAGRDERGALVFPAQFVLLLLLAAVVGFFLHRTAYGRYWYAIGHNEQAAHYAGVNVNRHRVVVYVVCSALAAHRLRTVISGTSRSRGRHRHGVFDLRRAVDDVAPAAAAMRVPGGRPRPRTEHTGTTPPSK